MAVLGSPNFDLLIDTIEEATRTGAWTLVANVDILVLEQPGPSCEVDPKLTKGVTALADTKLGLHLH